MLKVYQEHENFGAYTAFNLALGEMQPFDKIRFDSFENSKRKFINHKLSPTHTQFPRRIYLQITRNCQLSCEYCYVKAGPKQPHLPRSTILNMANFMGQQGLMEVRLTGGEATTHPDFIEICERFHQNNIYISLGTNGLWSNPIKEFLSAQRYFCLAITIDGSELTHDVYRQGSHKALIRNLYELRKKNAYIRFRINMVVTKSNKLQCPRLVQLAHDISAESLTFLPLRPRMNSPALLNEVLSAEEFREINFYANQFNATTEKKIIPIDVADLKTDENTFARFKSRKVCSTGRERLNLSFNDATQKIAAFACTFSPAMDESAPDKLRNYFIAGEFDYDAIEQLQNIWDDDTRWEVFRDRSLKAKSCNTCSSFGNSCGGTGFCHIQNHQYAALNLNEDLRQQLRAHATSLPNWCEQREKYTPLQSE